MPKNFVFPSNSRGQFRGYCKESEFVSAWACKGVCKEDLTVPTNPEAHLEREEVEDAAFGSRSTGKWWKWALFQATRIARETWACPHSWIKMCGVCLIDPCWQQICRCEIHISTRLYDLVPPSALLTAWQASSLSNSHVLPTLRYDQTVEMYQTNKKTSHLIKAWCLSLVQPFRNKRSLSTSYRDWVCKNLNLSSVYRVARVSHPARPLPVKIHMNTLWHSCVPCVPATRLLSDLYNIWSSPGWNQSSTRGVDLKSFRSHAICLNMEYAMSGKDEWVKDA